LHHIHIQYVFTNYFHCFILRAWQKSIQEKWYFSYT
jgi:hypothetical protein